LGLRLEGWRCRSRRFRNGWRVLGESERDLGLNVGAGAARGFPQFGLRVARDLVEPEGEPAEGVPFPGSSCALHPHEEGGNTDVGPFTGPPDTATVGWMAAPPVLRTTITMDADRGHQIDCFSVVIDTTSKLATSPSAPWAAAEIDGAAAVRTTRARKTRAKCRIGALPVRCRQAHDEARAAWRPSFGAYAPVHHL